MSPSIFLTRKRRKHFHLERNTTKIKGEEWEDQESKRCSLDLHLVLVANPPQVSQFRSISLAISRFYRALTRSWEKKEEESSLSLSFPLKSHINTEREEIHIYIYVSTYRERCTCIFLSFIHFLSDVWFRDLLLHLHLLHHLSRYLKG